MWPRAKDRSVICWSATRGGSLPVDEEALRSVAETMDEDLRLLRYRSAVLTADHFRAWSPAWSELAVQIERRRARALVAAGDPAGGADVLGTLVEALERRHGLDHPETQTIKLQYGEALADAGRVDETIRVFEAVIGDRRRLFGDDEFVVEARRSLAAIVFTVGRYRDGIVRYEALLRDLYAKQSYHHDTAWTVALELGAACWHAGSYGRGKAVLTDVRERIVRYARWRLSHVHLHTGAYDAAIALLHDVHAVESVVLGPDHPEALMTLHWVGHALYDAGEYDEGVLVLERTSDAQARVLGDLHPSALLSRHWIGLCLSKAGRFEEAAGVLAAIAEARIAVLGEDDAATLTSQQWLAEAYLKLDEPKRALALLELVTVRRTAVLGPDHPDTLGSFHSLGEALEKVGETARAIDVMAGATAGFARVRGPEHERTLLSQQWLGFFQCRAKRYEDARATFSATLEGRIARLGVEHSDIAGQRDRLGDDHPDTKGTQRCLARAEAT